MTREVGIIALVPDPWRSVWTVRHQVLSRLAAQFEVIWIEPARGWRDYWLPGAEAPGIDCGDVSGPPGLTVYDPGRWLPQVYRPRAVGRLFELRRIRAARRALLRKGCRRIVLYLWRPGFDWALDAPGIDFSCYHIDDEYQFSVVEKPNEAREERLIRSVDQVIVHCPALLRKKGGLNPRTIMVPNGADFRAFSAPRPEPPDLAAIARPRIGYIGVIKTQLNLALMLALATRNPQWSFVFVGPQGYLGDKAGLVRDLGALANVHFLGGKPHDALPAYAQGMDVCTMCYESNDYTKYIYPLKLHEYLAAGRPVVATPIAPLMPFREVVRLAGDEEEWQRAIGESLAPASVAAERIGERQRVARQNDWDELVGRIARAFRLGLGLAEPATGARRREPVRVVDAAP